MQSNFRIYGDCIMEQINILDTDNEFERVDKIIEKLNEIIDWINSQ